MNDSSGYNILKQPVEKKTKPSEDADVSNAAILTAIQGLESRVNDQLTELKEQAKQTSTMIASLVKAVQFNAEETKECKTRVKDLEEQNLQLHRVTRELKERVKEQERYNMRWCLWIIALDERKDEDTRK